MAASPKYKVYTPEKEYEASCKHGEVAAAIVAMLGDGATIRLDHSRILWTEGEEQIPASESYDGVAATLFVRERDGTVGVREGEPR